MKTKSHPQPLTDLQMPDDGIIFYFRMLDEFGNELDNTDSKLDATMRKMGKVLQLSNNDRRQWTAILILSVLLLIVIILFIIL